VSSLDFGASDPSEDEYEPSSRRKAVVPKKKAQGTGIKINLTALQRAREDETPIEEEEYYEDGGGEGFLNGLAGRWGVDLSGESLKPDHAARPLWIDESGNM